MKAQGEDLEVVPAMVGVAGRGEIVGDRRGHVEAAALEVDDRRAQDADAVAVDPGVGIAQVGLPEDGAGGDAGRAVGVLRRDGVDRSAPRGGKDDAQRLVLERRALDPVSGMVGGVARAGDEQAVEVQGRGVDGPVELGRLPDLPEARSHVGRGQHRFH